MGDKIYVEGGWMVTPNAVVEIKEIRIIAISSDGYREIYAMLTDGARLVLWKKLDSESQMDSAMRRFGKILEEHKLSYDRQEQATAVNRLCDILKEHKEKKTENEEPEKDKEPEKNVTEKEPEKDKEKEKDKESEDEESEDEYEYEYDEEDEESEKDEEKDKKPEEDKEKEFEEIIKTPLAIFSVKKGIKRIYTLKYGEFKVYIELNDDSDRLLIYWSENAEDIKNFLDGLYPRVNKYMNVE